MKSFKCLPILLLLLPSVTEATGTHWLLSSNLPRSLCNGCRMRNGKGYNADPTYCYSYILCHFNQGGFGAPERRPCTPGQFWDHSVVSCVPAAKVNCPWDHCHKHSVSGYAVKGNCRGYWRCENNRTIGIGCCKLGYRYYASSGCLHDPTCTDHCPPKHRTDNTCRYVVEPNNRRKFRINHHSRLTMCCPIGLEFEQSTCGCTRRSASNHTVGCGPSTRIDFRERIYDTSRDKIMIDNYQKKVIPMKYDSATDGWVGNFSGNGRLIMPRFTNSYFDSAFKFFIRFKEHPGSHQGDEILISNADCGAKPSLKLSFDRSSEMLTFMAKFNNRSVSVSVRYIKGAWKDVIVMLENGVLHMSVDNRDDWAKSLGAWQESVSAPGIVDTSKCALNVGWGRPGVSYYGLVDAFRVYLCLS